MASATVDLIDVVQKILDLDSKMRFAAIINLQGKIREAIMKTERPASSRKRKRSTFASR